MRETILLVVFMTSIGLGLLCLLIAGDLRRRRIEAKRHWYLTRLHTSLDRVEALKLEMEPPLEGIDGFAAVEVSRNPLRDPRPKRQKPSDPDASYGSELAQRLMEEDAE